MRRILLEVCIDSAQGLAAAIEGGADRIELCSALALGGLTPSPGFMAFAALAPIPSYAMIRPRAGNFVFSYEEIDMMRGDIDAARAAGLAGVVLGANLESGALNEAGLWKLKEHAAGMGATLHRAIDLVPDRLAAIDAAIGLGFERVLSSGGARTAPEGIEALAAMVERAAGRISVMPGSGVNAGNAASLIARLGVSELHGSCSAETAESDAKAVAFGFAPARARRDFGRGSRRRAPGTGSERAFDQQRQHNVAPELSNGDKSEERQQLFAHQTGGDRQRIAAKRQPGEKQRIFAPALIPGLRPAQLKRRRGKPRAAAKSFNSAAKPPVHHSAKRVARACDGDEQRQ